MKRKLHQSFKEKANGIRIRNKCDWYEHGEKSTKFFLNRENKHLLCTRECAKNKSPGNDALTKELYETFWDELKIPFIASLRK